MTDPLIEYESDLYGDDLKNCPKHGEYKDYNGFGCPACEYEAEEKGDDDE